MNILIFNTHNPTKEAGVVALDLFNELKGSGHAVRLLVNTYDNNYPEDIISLESSWAVRWKRLVAIYEWRLGLLKKFLRIKDKYRKDPNYRFFQIDESKKIYKTNKILKKAAIRPDIIILLFVKGFINVKNIYELNLKTGAKILWLMFDMAPFTGGCHYAWDCIGYQKTCGNCPALFSANPFDVSYKNLMYKKEYLDKTDIKILAGSGWQFKQAGMSALFKNKQIHKVLLSIDSSVFKPVDKVKLRTEMNIRSGRKIIFFGAVGLTEKRKGISYLIESLNSLKVKLERTDSDLLNSILLLVAGKGFNEIIDLMPFESEYVGYLDNNIAVASAYQAADVFICPSIEDSGPMMINQSIMCGTPVVSFEMGVSIDLVITGETGYRAKLKDSEDMAQGIFEILRLNSDDYYDLSLRCRKHALNLYSPGVRMKIFEDLMKN